MSWIVGLSFFSKEKGWLFFFYFSKKLKKQLSDCMLSIYLKRLLYSTDRKLKLWRNFRDRDSEKDISVSSESNRNSNLLLRNPTYTSKLVLEYYCAQLGVLSSLSGLTSEEISRNTSYSTPHWLKKDLLIRSPAVYAFYTKSLEWKMREQFSQEMLGLKSLKGVLVILNFVVKLKQTQFWPCKSPGVLL